MADTPGGVLIVVALIGAVATVIAAVIASSDGETTISSEVPSAVPSIVPVTITPSVPPGPPEPAEPEPSRKELAIPPAQTVPGDLGVSRPITRPACDGRFVVFVGAAVYPPSYRIDVQNLLDTYPDTEYLRSGDTCPSLRSRDGAGNQIYGVYYGPFGKEQACQVRNSQGESSYIKVLDTVTDPSVIIEC